MELQNATVEQLAQGFQQNETEVKCLFCSQAYAIDEVFPLEGKFYTAQGMMKQHLSNMHQSPFHAMLALDKKMTGLSEVQVDMLKHFYAQHSDQDIVEQSTVGSVSTVRQHRFKLREKERQAKLFLALMQCLQQPDAYQVHKGAKQVDERYGIEQQEREKVLATYFKDGLDQGITLIPSKEKKKLIILQHICTRFDKEKHYSEREVNEILKSVHADFVSLRRHLIEYGFMERSNDGSAYWVKQ